MWDLDMLVRLIGAAVGTVGLAGLFHTRPKHLPFAAIGGTITYLIYRVMELEGISLFICAFVSTLFLAVYSEICARLRRAPALIFLLTGAVPIVPGGMLYYTMSNFLSKNYEAGKQALLTTLGIGIGIAGGMVAVSLLVTVGENAVETIRKKLNK